MRGDRQPDAAKSTLYETMGAYSGTCRFDGNVFTTAVDMASDPSWEGSLRPRSFILEGNKLSLTTSEQRDHPNYPGRPSIGLVVWERET